MTSDPGCMDDDDDDEPPCAVQVALTEMLDEQRQMVTDLLRGFIARVQAGTECRVTGRPCKEGTGCSCLSELQKWTNDMVQANAEARAKAKAGLH
jgi:hypothetical protein